MKQSITITIREFGSPREPLDAEQIAGLLEHYVSLLRHGKANGHSLSESFPNGVYRSRAMLTARCSWIKQHGRVRVAMERTYRRVARFLRRFTR